jgi:glycine cleavage system H protein
VIPEDLKYTKEHEWVKLEDDTAIVGITDYAQGELGDIVFVELPKVGARIEAMKPFGTIEAVKAISDLFSPLSGEVVEINGDLEGDSSIINSDPYGSGWMIKIKVSDRGELDKLLSAADYKAVIEK